MPTGKSQIRGGIAWHKRTRLLQGDKTVLVKKVRKNRLPSMPPWTQKIERQLLSDIKAAIGKAVSFDKTSVPTATEQRKKLKRIQSLANELFTEIRGGSRKRGKKTVRVKELDFHTHVIMHQAVRRTGGQGFAGLPKRDFVDLLEDIANANAIDFVQPSSHSHPYQQYLLDELAWLWLTYTGANPDGVKTNPDDGKPFGHFFEWAQEIFWLAFEVDAPRERVAEAVSKLKK